MKRKLSIIMLLLFGSLVTHAQGNGFTCGSIPPSEKDNVRFQKFEQYIYQKLNQPTNARNASFGCSTDQGGVITLPVVVHIIDSSGVTIASNTNITQMIKNLNDQWRRITGDGVDMKIQFALAVRDPFGNATSGINRVSGRNIPNYLNSGLNLSTNLVSVLNLGNWRSDRYINIYIVTKLVGAAGYGTLPGNAGYDGIFLSPGQTFTNGNDFLTHEMGHYMGLFHTFETVFNDSGNECQNDNCLLRGDRNCDTPPVKVDDCGSTTCPGSGDPNNSFKNYMSYCNGATRFTQGQKDRVRAALFSEYRISLISSPALIPVTTSLEASIDSVVYVNNLASPLCGHKLDSVLLRINNLGTSNINLVKIGTSVAGVLTNTVTKSVTITPGTSKLVSVPAITFTAAGSYDLSFELLQTNSNRIDYDTLNNKVCTTVEPIILTVNTTTTASPPSGGVFTGGRSFTCNGIDTLRVFKNPGYDLIGIYDEGGNFITSDSLWYYPIDVNEFSTDKQFTAVLQKKSFTITTAVNPANAGTVTPGGTYDYGTSKTLETHKKIGYVFLHWKKNNIFYSSDSIIPITIDDNANYVAVYDIATGIKNNTLDIDVSIYPNPTSDVVNIAVASIGKFNGVISIVNILGQTLEQRVVNASTSNFQFDVSTFNKGSYFISLRDEESNTQEMYKFIVR